MGCEIDHSHPSSAEVKNEWSCASAPTVCLRGTDRDQFTFALYLSYYVAFITISSHYTFYQFHLLTSKRHVMTSFDALSSVFFYHKT
jgi:hypothetical protein